MPQPPNHNKHTTKKRIAKSMPILYPKFPGQRTSKFLAISALVSEIDGCVGADVDIDVDKGDMGVGVIGGQVAQPG